MCKQLSTRWQNGKGDKFNLYMQAHIHSCAIVVRVTRRLENINSEACLIV